LRNITSSFLVLLVLFATIAVLSPVKAQANVKFRGELLEIFYPDYRIQIREILVDPTGQMEAGEIAYVTFWGDAQIIGDPGLGDYVEVYGEYRAYLPPPQEEHQISIYLYDHYIRKIPLGLADLVIYQCGVSPSRPRQEDLVTFYAVVANVGGSDAYNFRLELWFSGGVEGWYLYDSGYLSLGAGESMQVSSDTPWRAEDGSYSYRWRVNPDRAIQESNYDNNECGGSFTVSPRTITLTGYTTVTRTTTRTEKITMTTTTTTYKGAFTTETVTRTVTFTGEAVTITVTLTGLYIRTSYSPTVTITVTQTGTVQMRQLPLFLSIMASIGAIIYRRRKEKLEG
jgi:hypothetical protein